MADRRRPRRPGGEAAPDLEVLFTNRYARNANVHHGRLDADVQMIGKPLTYADSAAKLRAVLYGTGWPQRLIRAAPGDPLQLAAE